MNNNAKEYEERNVTLKEEKEAIQKQFQSLKKRMNSFREEERCRLTELTLLSNRVVKILKGKVEMSEKIIKMAEMNRKLETETEKVLPFYTQVESSTDKVGPEPALDIELPKEFEGMEQFNKRYNKVLLDKVMIEKMHNELSLENVRLRAILKQYLDGISVTESVLRQPNPLLVVNGKTNAPIRQNRQGYITYVEAALVKG
jgi:chromosome segregation ATPase